MFGFDSLQLDVIQFKGAIYGLPVSCECNRLQCCDDDLEEGRLSETLSWATLHQSTGTMLCLEHCDTNGEAPGGTGI